MYGLPFVTRACVGSASDKSILGTKWFTCHLRILARKARGKDSGEKQSLGEWNSAGEERVGRDCIRV